MIPDESDKRWEALVKGTLKYNFSSVAASMCVARNQRKYRLNPEETTVAECKQDLINFFSKYEKIVQSDLEGLFS